MWIFLLWIFVVSRVSAIRPSARSPLIFVVSDLVGNGTYKGTSIRLDGNWIPGDIETKTIEKIRSVYPEATVLVVNTDDEKIKQEDIETWMRRECLQVKKKSDHDCFVVSSKFKYGFKTSADPYDFRRWESSLRLVVKKAITPIKVTALGSASPTYRITRSPTISHDCTLRSEQECLAPDCEYYGFVNGCRRMGWCGFTSKLACEARATCEFRRSQCRKKLT